MDSLPRGRIMAVDDSNASLELLEAILRPRGYEVRSFPAGELALAEAARNAPDLILMDIEMPVLNGYQVCARLKSSARLSEVPVIFLSARTATEDKLQAFQAGGVDYVSKPFQIDEVQARVEIHLRLRRAQEAGQALLDKTLHGSLGVLWELVQLTSPMLAVRSRAIRDIVACIAARMAPRDPWQYELAAMLCLAGCIPLPDEVVEKAYSGQGISPDEERMFRSHPENTSRLLSNIPRLEIVAEMIRRQHEPAAGPPVSAQARLGAQMLHLAWELDRMVYRGAAFHTALHKLRMSPERFDARMLDALAGYSPAAAEIEVRLAPIRNLREGMVLEEDICSQDGMLLILKQGTVLTKTWIERLKNFAKVRGVRQLVRIRVPKLAAAGAILQRNGGSEL